MFTVVLTALMGCLNSSDPKVPQPAAARAESARAGTTLGRRTSRGNARPSASAEERRRWKIFTSLDYRDDRERLEMVRFIQAVKSALKGKTLDLTDAQRQDSALNKSCQVP